MSSDTPTTAHHMLKLARELVSQSTALAQVDPAQRARLADHLQGLGNALHQLDRHAKTASDGDFDQVAILMAALLDDLQGVLDANALEHQRRRLGAPALPDMLHAEVSAGSSGVLAAIENAAGEFAALGVGLRKHS